jgi:PAS domain S-box-containing protein
MKELSNQNELTFQHTLLTSIINNSNDAILSKTLAGIITSWNKGAEKIFGYSSEETIGKHISMLIPPHLQHEETIIIEKIAKGESVEHYETERVGKDGKSVYVSLTISPVKDSMGNIVGASKICRDITEKKKFEEQKDLFASIINSSDDAILSLTLNGTITSWNHGAEKIFGYSSEEVIDKHVSILLPPNVSGEENEIMRKISSGESIKHYETERMRKDGKIINLSLTISPIKDLYGNITGAAGICRDITERKEAAAKLNESRELYRHTLDNMMEGVQIHDYEWKYIYVNDALVKYSHYKKEDLLGYTLFEKYPGIENTNLFKVLNKCMIERISEHLETEFVFPDGSKAFFELSIQPVPEGLFILSIDITQRKKDEEKINKANRLYAFISQINQSIVHIKDKQNLFDKACEVAFEVGKFKYAWIGMIDANSGNLNLVAQSGFAADDLAIYKDVDYRSPAILPTPLGQAITTGEYVCVNDSMTDHRMEGFKELAAKRGYHSNIVLPIKQSGKTVGVFCCNSSVTNFFDKEEIELLTEAAGDISFALDVYKQEEERTEYEKKLEDSELSMREAQSVANIGSWEHDYLTNIVTWSEELCRIYGLQPDQTIQSVESFLSFIHPDDAAFVRSQVQEALLKSKGHSFYCKVIRKDGAIRHVYTKSRFKFDNAGKPIGIYGITHDITERKETELQLKSSEAFNKGVLSALKSHIAVINSRGVIISTNDAWKEFSINNGQTILQNTSEGSNYYAVCAKSAIAGDTIAGEVLAGIKEVISNKSPAFYIEYPCHSPVEERWFAMQAIKFESDEPMVIVSHQNITARKLAEVELQQSEKRLLEYFECAPEAILALDISSGCFVNYNNNAVKLLKFSGEELLKMNPISISPEFQPDGIRSDIKAKEVNQKALNGENPIFEWLHKDATGVEIICEVRLVLLTQSKEPQVLATILDIRERKKAEIEKELLLNELIQNNKELTQFSYITTHNLRAPLTNLISICNLIKPDKIEDGRTLKLIEGFKMSTHYLNDTLNDLIKVLIIKENPQWDKEKVVFQQLFDKVKGSI